MFLFFVMVGTIWVCATRRYLFFCLCCAYLGMCVVIEATYEYIIIWILLPAIIKSILEYVHYLGNIWLTNIGSIFVFCVCRDYFESTGHSRVVFSYYHSGSHLFVLCHLRAKVCHERPIFAIKEGYVPWKVSMCNERLIMCHTSELFVCREGEFVP